MPGVSRPWRPSPWSHGGQPRLEQREQALAEQVKQALARIPGACAAGDIRGRGDGEHALQRRDHYDVLASVAPGEVQVVAREPLLPPEVAIAPTGRRRNSRTRPGSA